MSVDYTYACQRAELLGLPAPTEEEWAETQKTEEADPIHDKESADDAAIQNLDNADETAQRISGGLDELNSILCATQKKLNRFKTVCGSIGTILKVRVGSSRATTPNHKPTEINPNASGDGEEQAPINDETIDVEISDSKDTNDPGAQTGDSTATTKKIDINEKMGSHLNKLDSLISKAENAQYSMQHQTKQMRKFLK